MGPATLPPSCEQKPEMWSARQDFPQDWSHSALYTSAIGVWAGHSRTSGIPHGRLHLTQTLSLTGKSAVVWGRCVTWPAYPQSDDRSVSRYLSSHTIKDPCVHEGQGGYGMSEHENKNRNLLPVVTSLRLDQPPSFLQVVAAFTQLAGANSEPTWHFNVHLKWWSLFQTQKFIRSIRWSNTHTNYNISFHHPLARQLARVIRTQVTTPCDWLAMQVCKTREDGEGGVGSPALSVLTRWVSTSELMMLFSKSSQLSVGDASL